MLQHPYSSSQVVQCGWGKKKPIKCLLLTLNDYKLGHTVINCGGSHLMLKAPPTALSWL